MDLMTIIIGAAVLVLGCVFGYLVKGKKVASVLKELGEVGGAYNVMLADGKIEGHEVKNLLKEIKDVLIALGVKVNW